MSKVNRPSLKLGSTRGTAVVRETRGYSLQSSTISRERYITQLPPSSRGAFLSVSMKSTSRVTHPVAVEDGDAIWDRLFAESPDVLAYLAAEALTDDDAGLTEPLDLDAL